MKQKTLFMGMLSVILLFFSCTEADNLILDATDGQTYFKGDVYTDKYGNQGIVCTTFETDNTIMIVSLDEALLAWGPLDMKVSPYDSISIFHGSGFYDSEYYNLAVLRSAMIMGIEQFPALKWCNDKNHGEKFPSATSWHLPNLKEFYRIKSAVKYLPDIDISNKYYWTCLEDLKGCSDYGLSTENYLPKDRAMPLNLQIQTFSNKDLWNKRNKYYVRAVKYIYYERKD